jgi:hypothetical protein
VPEGRWTGALKAAKQAPASGALREHEAVIRTSLALSLCVWAASPVAARTLDVGDGRQFKQPSEAIAVAKDGDTIDIYPGQYFDCAIVRQNHLVIEGKGAGVVMTDKPCSEKALLVIDGNDITIHNLTLQRARVPDQNGAGIRAEGGDLTVENARFLDNENGILGADRAGAKIRIIGSEFVGNGKCAQACAHAIYVGHVALLRVEQSKFLGTHSGHNIKSRAARTEVVDSVIQDGPDGSSSYLIETPNGGSLIVEGNTMQKGPKTDNPANAIMIGAEGVSQPTEEIVIKNNTFSNDQRRRTTFVRNITATRAQLVGNTFKGDVRPLDGDGSVQ